MQELPLLGQKTPKPTLVAYRLLGACKPANKKQTHSKGWDKKPLA
jgi:hypothetical protein